MSWIYLAAPGNSDAPCTTPWLPTASGGVPLPTVKESGQLKGFFSAGSCAERSTLPLFARMSAKSRRQAFNGRLGLWAWTSSSEASPARISAQRALGLAWKKGSAAAFSSKSSDALASLDPASLRWKTFQLLLLEEGSESLVSLPPSGMTADGQLFRLRTSVRPTSGQGGGSWPTPLKSDSDKFSGPHSGKNDTLTSEAKAWSTPSKGDGDGSRSVPEGTTETGRKPDGSKAQMGLNVQAKAWLTPRATEPDETAAAFSSRMGDRTLDCFGSLTGQAKNWATPAARDFKSGQLNARQGTDSLNVQASALARPTPRASSTTGAGSHGRGAPDLQTVASQSAHLTPPTGKAGLGSWPLLLNYVRQLRSAIGFQRRKPGRRSRSPRLNPLFEEWLLGSPIGMTEYEPAVTAWILSAPGKRLNSFLEEPMSEDDDKKGGR